MKGQKWGGVGEVEWLYSGVGQPAPASSNSSRSSDGLVTGVAPLPADEVGQEHNEDEPRQGCSHYDGDQQVVFVQLAFHS